jgi:hypothetical protein
MKKFFAILGIILLLLVAYIWYSFKSGGKTPKGPKPISLAVSKHSPAFNQSIQSLLDAYYNMSEGLARYGNEFNTALDSLKIEELKVDTTGIYESALDPVANAKNETANILKEPSIDKKRTSFNALSENLRLLFIVVKYDQGKLYWQECPMAFGEGNPGNWLSKTDAVRNPYLGTKHPEHKDGMLHCGGPKDTINFIVPDTTGKK